MAIVRTGFSLLITTVGHLPLTLALTLALALALTLTLTQGRA